MNLDKIFSVWNNIEETYLKKASNKSREDFLSEQLRYETLNKLQSLIEIDFVDTKENQARKELLFQTLNRAKDRLNAKTSEILNLNVFVWDDENWETNSKPLCINDYDVFANSKTCNELEDLISKGFYSSTYILKGEKVERFVLNPASEHLVFFQTGKQVVKWISEQNGLAEKSDFIKGVMKYLMHCIRENDLCLPMALYTTSEPSFNQGKGERLVSPLKESFYSDATFCIKELKFPVPVRMVEIV